MLEQLRLENFKSFKKAQIDLGQITVLIGPNGTGKSSWLQAMMLMRQSSGHSTLRTQGKYLNLGGYKDLLHRGNKGYRGRHLKIGIAGTSELAERYDEIAVEKHIPYIYESEFEEGQLVGHEGKISISGDELVFRLFGNERSVTPIPLEFRGVSFSFNIQNLIGAPVIVSGCSKAPEIDERKLELVRHYVVESLRTLHQTLESVFFVPAIRGFAAPSYPLQDMPVTDFVTSAGAVEHAQRLASTLAYRRELEDILSKWCMRITGITVRIALREHRVVTIETSLGAAPKFNIVHEGFGSNQLIFGLAQLATSPTHSIICWEEPEIHLHPRAQSELVNVLVEVAKREDKQIVITTHSEHILYPFVSAVRNGSLTRDELAIYYFEERGEQPRRVEQDECGDIYEWGRNFFSAP